MSITTAENERLRAPSGGDEDGEINAALDQWNGELGTLAAYTDGWLARARIATAELEAERAKVKALLSTLSSGLSLIGLLDEARGNAGEYGHVSDIYDELNSLTDWADITTLTVTASTIEGE